MGTPFINFLGPSDLSRYDRKKGPSEQSGIPQTFLDAMEVREEVFVKEQGVPLENEFDSDDARACHWVTYASINTLLEPEVKDADGNVVLRKKSVTRSTPIGTIRLVPFPHPPHPESGSVYTADAPETGSSDPPPYIVDRATTFHDGKEPYVKLGRLAVIQELRGSGIAKMLVGAALSWAQKNPTFFNPSVVSMGMDKFAGLAEVPVWKGLVCVHAQIEVAKTWAKWGFSLDDDMGEWNEEGIEHVGMFQRLEFER